MKPSSRGQVAFALVALALAGLTLAVWARRQAPAERDFPGGVRMVCLAPGCGERFAASAGDLARAEGREPGAGIRCPRCGSADTAAAVICPACGGWFARDARTSEPRCPRCGEIMPKAGK